MKMFSHSTPIYLNKPILTPEQHLKLNPPKIMAIQPTPPQTYPPQKYWFNKALLRETNGFS